MVRVDPIEQFGAKMLDGRLLRLSLMSACSSVCLSVLA